MKITFYTDPSKKIINPELMAQDAHKWAEMISKAGLNSRGNKLEKNKISQLRKFYDEAQRLADLVRNGEDFRNVIPYIKMLNAKAAYAEGRKLVTSEFKNFISSSVAEIKIDDQVTFDLFLSFFEAFMGYYKFEESKHSK